MISGWVLWIIVSCAFLGIGVNLATLHLIKSHFPQWQKSTMATLMALDVVISIFASIAITGAAFPLLFDFGLERVSRLLHNIETTLD